MSPDLSIKDGFKITESVHRYAACHVYKGVPYNGPEFRVQGSSILVCNKMKALGGYRLTVPSRRQ
jgi:hypothetical protein